ncbi:hypothetical protein M8120_24180 [Microcystis aeruginosa str. Chao 1910]|uniref:hypothetical protein n=1 Tax=Microcystis aeruginosa TaxID=1126 RepID=UPI0022477EB3|nr:hypothetical protein [Microcystis aeruginosa]UZO75782.1 hypothetical protein M8120_24180 [Microcystis aeruginosa str. Chao 1910]
MLHYPTTPLLHTPHPTPPLPPRCRGGWGGHTPLPHTPHPTPHFPDDREKTSSRGEQLPVR